MESEGKFGIPKMSSNPGFNLSCCFFSTQAEGFAMFLFVFFPYEGEE